MKSSKFNLLRRVLFRAMISRCLIIFACPLNSSIVFLVVLSGSCVVHDYQQFRIRVLSHAYQAFSDRKSSSAKKPPETPSSLPALSLGLSWIPPLTSLLPFHYSFLCQRSAFHTLVLAPNLPALALSTRHLLEQVFYCTAPLILSLRRSGIALVWLWLFGFVFLKPLSARKDHCIVSKGLLYRVPFNDWFLPAVFCRTLYILVVLIQLFVWSVRGQT